MFIEQVQLNNSRMKMKRKCWNFEENIAIHDWYSLGLRLARFNSHFANQELFGTEEAWQVWIALPLELEHQQVPYIHIRGH